MKLCKINNYIIKFLSEECQETRIGSWENILSKTENPNIYAKSIE